MTDLNKLSPQDANNLRYRMDKRTPSQFKADIKKYTNAEKIAAYIFQIELTEKGFKNVSYSDYGMDNTGEVITASAKVNANPDYVYKYEMKSNPSVMEVRPIEFKVHPEKFPCMTFKINELKRYIKRHAGLVIVRDSHWAIFTTEGMEYMMNNFEHKIYKNFKDNALAVRLYNQDLDKMKPIIGKDKKPLLRTAKWSNKAQELIDDNKEKLFSR